jgi:hypothetical protein
MSNSSLGDLSVASAGECFRDVEVPSPTPDFIMSARLNITRRPQVTKGACAALGVVALLLLVPGSALATHGGYHTPCGDRSSHPTAADTTLYSTPTGAGVIGSNGYVEAGAAPSGTSSTAGIHGGTSGGELYGHVSDDGVCVGSAPAGVHRDVPL